MDKLNQGPGDEDLLTNGIGGGAAAKKTKEDREEAAAKARAEQEFKPTEAMVKANTPPKEVDGKKAITVTISNCRWNRDRGAYGDTVIAHMDVHIPPAQEDKNRVMVGVELQKSVPVYGQTFPFPKSRKPQPGSSSWNR